MGFPLVGPFVVAYGFCIVAIIVFFALEVDEDNMALSTAMTVGGGIAILMILVVLIRWLRKQVPSKHLRSETREIAVKPMTVKSIIGLGILTLLVPIMFATNAKAKKVARPISICGAVMIIFGVVVWRFVMVDVSEIHQRELARMRNKAFMKHVENMKKRSAAVDGSGESVKDIYEEFINKTADLKCGFSSEANDYEHVSSEHMEIVGLQDRLADINTVKDLMTNSWKFRVDQQDGVGDSAVVVADEMAKRVGQVFNKLIDVAKLSDSTVIDGKSIETAMKDPSFGEILHGIVNSPEYKSNANEFLDGDNVKLYNQLTDRDKMIQGSYDGVEGQLNFGGGLGGMLRAGLYYLANVNNMVQVGGTQRQAISK